MQKTTSARDVAEFMAAQLREKKWLYQEDVVWEIERRFGKQFVHTNENLNQAINKDVLDEFRKLTPDAVWERGEKMWRSKESYDQPGKRGQD